MQPIWHLHSHTIFQNNLGSDSPLPMLQYSRMTITSFKITFVEWEL